MEMKREEGGGRRKAGGGRELGGREEGRTRLCEPPLQPAACQRMVKEEGERRGEREGELRGGKGRGVGSLRFARLTLKSSHERHTCLVHSGVLTTNSYSIT